jgi:NDP-sugar pyrophosphorylase family protein
VVGLHLWDEILTPSSRANTMVIMAGGRGRRLHAHTENCPKPMLEVGGKPMLEHIIERAKSDGFVNFALAIHYLGNMVEDYFAEGRRWGVNIEYLREERPLGTAGALSLIGRRPEVPFIVTNGDLITDVHYGEILEFHMRHHASATMAVRQHELQNPFGVVRTSGVEITGFEEKPIYRSHINAGIYVLSPETLHELQPGQFCDMPTLFTRVQDRKGRAIVYPMHEPWLDVGRPDDLALARDQAT